VDILAARKKAAERAKAAKELPGHPSPAEERAEAAEELTAALPPLPETTFVPDEVMPFPDEAEPPMEAAASAPAGPASGRHEEAEAPAGAEPAADAPEAEEEGSAEEEAGEEQEQEREMLAFQLGSEEYVVPVDLVQEVLTPREITPVPHSREFVLGVCSLRGIVLPIIDLHRRLGLPEAARDDRSRILVMNLGPDDRLGLFVDRVRGVVRFLPSTVRPVPETIEQGAEFLQGIVRAGDRLLILLDVEKTTEI